MEGCSRLQATLEGTFSSLGFAFKTPPPIPEGTNAPALPQGHPSSRTTMPSSSLLSSHLLGTPKLLPSMLQTFNTVPQAVETSQP